MKDFYVFAESLAFIEARLHEEYAEPLSQEEIAAHCGCSVSALQKIWKYCTRQGVMHYIKRRRLTLAARDLAAGAPVLDTALKYGYGSGEAFTRAFSLMWGVCPSEFAKSRSFTGLYPKLYDQTEQGGILMHVKFDLTALYEKLADKKGTYIVCFDIKRLMWINEELSSAHGDEVIKATAARIDRALTEEMFAFRIGGDEFAVVTGYREIADAQAFADAITAQNDETVTLNGITAPVQLYSGIMRWEGAPDDFYEAFEQSLVRE